MVRLISFKNTRVYLKKNIVAEIRQESSTYIEMLPPFLKTSENAALFDPTYFLISYIFKTSKHQNPSKKQKSFSFFDLSTFLFGLS